MASREGEQDLPPGRALGIDPGTKRIGFALSDELGWTASPLEVWRRRSTENDVAHVAELVTRLDVRRIVVGVPYRLDGTKGAAAETALAFVRALRSAIPDVPIDERDEALTTWEAEQSLKARGLLPLDRRELIDAHAAAVILQEDLDARAKRAPPATEAAGERGTTEAPAGRPGRRTRKRRGT